MSKNDDIYVCQILKFALNVYTFVFLTYSSNYTTNQEN